MALQSSEDNSSDVVFRDFFVNALCMFVFIVIIILQFINPAKESEGEAELPGNISVELRWPDESTSDVDLWVLSPDNSVVGFARKSGDIFNLLRDDLGQANDVSDLNYEFAFSRGAPKGKYAVNVNLYRYGKGDTGPVKCTVIISIKKKSSSHVKNLFKKEVLLSEVNKEVTIYQFELDERANVIASSVTTNQISFML